MATPARYRQTASSRPSKSSPPASTASATSTEKQQHAAGRPKGDASASGFSLFDVLRVLGGILVLSCGMSYLSTSGESMTWGYNPWWTRAREWKAIWNGHIRLTDAALSHYDGTDPSKPIYLALNGTIYDVSANPKTYGPGGSYHFFAGRDAARAFLTGCFQEDRTPDLRGVEEMYIPIDPPQPTQDPGQGKAWRKKELSKAEVKIRHAWELRKARKEVKDGLEHWHVLFRGDKAKPYFKVGEVEREQGWLEKLPKRELCAEAKKGRPTRPVEEVWEAVEVGSE